MRFTNLLAISLAVLLSGCASTYKQEIISSPSEKLERGRPVVIAKPSNGSYENKEYRSSGMQTAQAVKAAFARYSNNVVVTSSCSTLQCLQSESNVQNAYYVVPEILHWEDRNTEWSGIPDRIEIKLLVVDAINQREVASTLITGTSKWATFGGDHPEDLLPEPVNTYVQSLF